jgi:hypothetical protein
MKPASNLPLLLLPTLISIQNILMCPWRQFGIMNWTRIGADEITFLKRVNDWNKVCRMNMDVIIVFLDQTYRTVQLLPYDAVNRNKVSIRQLPLYFHSLHVSAPTGHLQVRYTIRYFKDFFTTTDPLYVHNLTYRCYMSYIGTSTRSPQYMLSNLVQI